MPRSEDDHDLFLDSLVRHWIGSHDFDPVDQTFVRERRLEAGPAVLDERFENGQCTQLTVRVAVFELCTCQGDRVSEMGSVSLTFFLTARLASVGLRERTKCQLQLNEKTSEQTCPVDCKLMLSTSSGMPS